MVSYLPPYHRPKRYTFRSGNCPTIELHEQHLASTVAQALDATQLAVTGFPAPGFPLAWAVLRPPFRRAVHLHSLREEGVPVRPARDSGTRTAIYE